MRPEAGWYPDPRDAGQLRWWDGSAWTTQTQSAAGAVPAVPPEPDLVKRPAPSPQTPTESGRDLGRWSPGSAQGQPAEGSYGAPGAGGYGTPGGPAPDAPGHIPLGDAGPGQPGYQSSGSQPSGYQQAPAQHGYQAPESFQPGGYSYSGSYGSSPYPASPTAQYPGGAPLANQGLRLVARFIDYVILLIPISLIVSPWYGPYSVVSKGYLKAIESGDTSGVNPLADSAYTNFLLATIVANIAVYLVYEGLMLKFVGATLGKLICGLRVRSERGDGQLSWGQALGRVGIMVLPAMVTCYLWNLVDSLWCLWDRRRQCLHDKVAKTIVVTTRSRR